MLKLKTVGLIHASMVYPLAPRFKGAGKRIVPPVKFATNPPAHTGPAMPRGVTPSPYVPSKALRVRSSATVGIPGASSKVQKPVGLSPSTWLMKSARAG